MSWAEMEIEDKYDYSGSSIFIEKFVNPFAPSPFIDNVVENQGTLWRLNDCVKN